MSPQQATFTFPATPAEGWPVNQPIIERFQSTVEYGWAVRWAAPEGSGLGIRELALFRRRDSVPEPARLTLQQLVDNSSHEVIHEGSHQVGDGGVVAFTDESAFAVKVEDRRIVFRLTGAQAVQRYTSWRPDTAIFEVSRFSETAIECRAMMQYSSSR